MSGFRPLGPLPGNSMTFRLHLRCALLVLPVLLIGASTQTSRADADAPTTKPAEKTDFLRFVDDGKGGGTLQTAIATYQNDNGVTVHLVGAVHVGEKAYYQSLNKTFADYDALLYEMIKPAGAGTPEPGQRPESGVSIFQHFLKDVLELDFQLDDVDYRKPNFVHADLDYETFTKMQEERGESILGLMMQAMMKELARQDEHKGPEFGLMDLLDALQSPDRARQLKLILAQQFGEIEDAFSGNTVLITERNRTALKVLRRQIAKGKKDIGIFYGAGHMHDMEERLEDMGFHRTALEWRVSWDMTAKPEPKDDDN